MPKETYEARIDELISQVKDKDSRTMFSIQSKSRMYPKDCLTNGALEKLVKTFIELEKKAEANNGIVAVASQDR